MLWLVSSSGTFHCMIWPGSTITTKIDGWESKVYMGIKSGRNFSLPWGSGSLTFPSLFLCRGGYPKAGGSPGRHSVDRYLPVTGQCHRERDDCLFQQLLIWSWTGICCAAALDHTGQRCQPGKTNKRSAPTAPHWRCGKDTLCHGGQPTGRLTRQQQNNTNGKARVYSVKMKKKVCSKILFNFRKADSDLKNIENGLTLDKFLSMSGHIQATTSTSS